MTLPAVTDALGRPMRDLRISVTDRCNFRCVYCMPKEVFGRDHAFLPRAEILDFEEIARVVQASVELGVRKVRLTGGEPLVRRNLEELVRMLRHDRWRGGPHPHHQRVAAGCQGLGSCRCRPAPGHRQPGRPRRRDVHGHERRRLPRLAGPRRDRGSRGRRPRAGQGQHGRAARAQRARHHRPRRTIPRNRDGGALHRVHGRRPLQRLAHGRRHPGCRGDRHDRRPLAARAGRRRLPGEVAQRWRYLDGAGEIGVITSVTEPFCGDCTRARLSADGQLYTCLFATGGHDVRALLRSGLPDEGLADALRAIWAGRDDRYTSCAPSRRSICRRWR